MTTTLSRLAACSLLAGALSCVISVPTQLPPPFGPSDPPDPARLFFPTGIAVAPSGQLLVVNANFDRAYDSGTMLALDGAFVAAQFAGDPAQTVRTDALPPAAVLGKALIASFGGPLALDQSGTIAYTAGRATNVVEAVRLNPATGDLSCVPGGGTDCRTGLVDLKAAVNLEGPYGVVAGTSRLPGDTTDHATMFVSSLVPHIDQIVNGSAQTYGRVAALSTDAPGNILYTMDVSNPLLLDGIGAGPMIFDGARRQVILGGCYKRFPAGSSGDPTTAKCTVAGRTNPIRFVNVDAGSDAQVRVFDLAASVSGNETTSLVLGGEDAFGVAKILYATSRNPDLLVELELPLVAGQDPILRRVTPLPLSPSNAVRLQRPAGLPGPDLIAVAGSGNSSLSIYDAFSGQVVAQVNGLGDFPFALAQLPPKGTTAQLVATVFGSCQLAFLDVDYAQPSSARLRAVVGKCPP